MATETKQNDVDALRKDIDDLKAALAELSKDVKSSAEAREHRFAEAARSKIEDIEHGAADFAKRAADRGRQSAEAVENTVRERPVQSLLVAFGAGLLLAKLLDRR